MQKKTNVIKGKLYCILCQVITLNLCVSHPYHITKSDLFDNVGWQFSFNIFILATVVNVEEYRSQVFSARKETD